MTVEATGEATATTTYVIDHHNPTGYSQVLEERDASNEVVRAYTLGHDLIAPMDVSAPNSLDRYYFAYDGHGSASELVGLNYGLLEALESYAYDAYGNLRITPTGPLLTSFLYSGEMTDATTGQQYLRARYYDPSTGRFNRLDPFAGNVEDPQSLHKYVYSYADPTNLTDPTGLTPTLGGTIATIGIGLNVASFLNNFTTAYHSYRSGDYNGGNEAFGWALLDIAFLMVPFSGIGGQSTKLALSTGHIAQILSLSRTGVGLSALWGYIQTLRVAASGFEFSYATGSSTGPTAGATLGGPGKVINTNEQMPDISSAYQQSVGGLPSGKAYLLNDVRFDGFSDVLIEAKGPGYSKLIRDPWISDQIAEVFLKQVRRQLRAAKGKAIKWFVAEADVADGVQRLFQENNIRGVSVIHRP